MIGAISITQEINRTVGFIASLINMVGIRHPFFFFQRPKANQGDHRFFTDVLPLYRLLLLHQILHHLPRRLLLH